MNNPDNLARDPAVPVDSSVRESVAYRDGLMQRLRQDAGYARSYLHAAAISAEGFEMALRDVIEARNSSVERSASVEEAKPSEANLKPSRKDLLAVVRELREALRECRDVLGDSDYDGEERVKLALKHYESLGIEGQE